MKTEEIYLDIVEKLSRIRENREILIEVLNFLEAKMSDDTGSDNQIPPEYADIIEQITEALNDGFACFLNPETLEVEQVSNSGLFGVSETEYDEQNDDMVDEFGLDYPEWGSYVRFEPFGRNDMLNVMEKYVDLLHDDTLRIQLENLSDDDGIVDRFDGIMERTGNMEDWNSFKKKEIENYVTSHLMSGLENKLSTEDDIYSLST
ncbi:MAG: hypothetical protein LBV74_20115 [Tannerella sp.]|jgi:hypothetical protein|nr:hypothetical protein [Tannerella sp.]